MLRKFLNVSIAATALLILAIPLLLIAVLIKLTSPGPALFRQQRVGKFGRPFHILKFRTMMFESSPGAGITIGRDPRITSTGAFLRKTKIDELPQLINVLKGDMSLVGPRPELPEFVRQYPPEDLKLVLSTEPGLTDFASICYRNESEVLGQMENPRAYYERVVIRKKLRYSRFYVRRASISLDAYVIWLTIRSIMNDAWARHSDSGYPHGARSISRRRKAEPRSDAGKL
jgi:lipopolysaccharide/colanic/teichoic acid biosynthesis glycosyltransferase